MLKRNKWENDEIDALKELVKIYGNHRPSDISHQLKHIYGIEKTRKQVIGRCRIINLGFSTKDHTQDELNQIWELYKTKEEEFASYKLDINFPRRKWKPLISQSLKKYSCLLNNTFGNLKKENRIRLQKITISIWTEALKLSKEELPKEDKIYNDVVKSCKQLFELLDPLMKNQVQLDQLFNYYEFKINRNEIQNIFEHLFLIRRIKDITKNNFEINQDINDEEELSDIDEGKPKINKLSKQEVDVLRRSQLYLRLQPENPRKFFYDWYNSAVKNHEKDSQFTIVFCDNEKKVEIKKELRLDEKQKSNKLPIWKKIKRQRDQQISEWSQRFLKDLEFE